MRLSSGSPLTIIGLLMAGTLTGCGDGLSSPADLPGEELPVITLLSGEEAFGSAGEALAEPLVVQVTAASGRPIWGQPVHFEVVSGGGTLSTGEARTNRSGMAESDWILGPESGWQEVEIRSGDASRPGRSALVTYRVRALPPGPYVVRLSPSSLELASPGDTARLTAEVLGEADDPIDDVPVTWTSTDEDVATVSEDGLVLATGTGEAYVTAGFREGVDSTHVRIEPALAAPYPNEPAGYTPISDRPFHSREENGWRTSTTSNFSIVSDPTAPASGPTVGQALFPAGFNSGSSPIWTEHQISSRDMTSIYVSFWLKVSDNFQGHPVNSKIAYFLTHGKPVVFPVYIGGDDAPLSTEVRIQDTPDGSTNYRPNLENVTIERGEWHHWEIVLVNNTGSRLDGEIHWWIDGVPVGSYDTVRFSSSSQSKVWDRLTWRPVWGGQGGTVREDMYMWMDEMYASGTR